ncbi:MAG: hypothetical protein KDJ31_18565 [Candidatus Competibacteraceae bacterium]|nr:hypothetical protein [Candidatus Competibacteraceae bacterium]
MSRSLCCIKYVFYLLCVALLLFNRPAQAASPPIVAAGAFHTMAVDSHGTVWAWGRNEDAQLGFGYRTTIDQLTPVQVTGLSNIVAVAAGAFHTVAVDSHGTVWACGCNFLASLEMASPAST